MARLNLTELAGSISPHVDRSAGVGLLAALAETTTTDATPTVAAIATVSAHPGNVRTDLGDLTELAESMQSAGIIQPLVVVTAAAWSAANPGHATAGGWVVIAGHRRLAAAQLAGLTEVPIVVRDELAAPAAATAAMLIENIHRRGLAPLDEATALQALADSGLSQRDVAARTGLSQGTVSKRIALLGLTDAGRHALRDEKLSPDVALDLLKLPQDRQDTVLARGLAQDYVRGAITAEVETIRREKRRQKVIDELLADGVTVVDDAATHLGISLSDAYAQHLLTGADDITAARAVGLAVATVENYGYVTWWCTHPAPWPWDTPAEEERAGDADSDGITPPPITPRAAAAEARSRSIAEYLSAESPAGASGLLASLALMLHPYADDNAVARLLGVTGDDGLDDLVGAATTDPALRVRLALATLMTLTEREVTIGDTWQSITPRGRDYLTTLEHVVGYTRAPHEQPPTETDTDGDGS